MQLRTTGEATSATDSGICMSHRRYATVPLPAGRHPPENTLHDVATAAREARQLYRERRRRSAQDLLSEAFSNAVQDALHSFHAVDLKHASHLVHYTGLDVLFSILRPTDPTGQSVPSGLRLYDTVHANDPEEGSFLPKHWPRNPLWAWNMPDLEDPLSDRGQRASARSPAYVLSFFQSSLQQPVNDHLGFWKEYGREGRGCSIAIPVEPLLNLSGLSPYRLRYDDDGISELFHHLEENLLEPAVGFIKDPEIADDFRQAIERILLDSMQAFRFLYKARTYAHECECRVVLCNPTDPETPQIDLVYEPQPAASGGTKLRHFPRNHVVPTDVLFHSDTEILLGPLIPQAHNVTIVLEKMLRQHSDSLGKDENGNPRHPPAVGKSSIRYRKI